MQCEKCGGDCWNNAAKNTERVAQGKKPMPLWVCKNKDGCGWVKWPPKTDTAKSAKAAPAFTWETLAGTYARCRKVAEWALPKETPPDVLVSATATLFIQAARDGLTAPLKDE